MLLVCVGCDNNTVYREFMAEHYAAIKSGDKIYAFCFPVLPRSELTKGYNVKLKAGNEEYLCTLKDYEGNSLVMSEKEYLKKVK